MGWDKGKYYTRSRKVNGRVVREYVGCGQAGNLMARLDDIARQVRQACQRESRREREVLLEADRSMKRHFDLIELLARAALVASGYHQHRRGEWRKRREHGDAK